MVSKYQSLVLQKLGSRKLSEYNISRDTFKKKKKKPSWVVRGPHEVENIST